MAPATNGSRGHDAYRHQLKTQELSFSNTDDTYIRSKRNQADNARPFHGMPPA
jgi:hypothetical protein